MTKVQPRIDPKEFRKRFIDAAWALGASRGGEGVKIRDIAEAVGVSAALIYAYFEDKASLMAELQAIGAERFDAMVTERSQLQGGDDLLGLCECYLEHMRVHGWLYAAPPGLSADTIHVRAFLRRASTLLDAADGDVRAIHLWIGVHGLFAAGQCAPSLAEQLDAREHLTLLIDAVRRHGRRA